jgi:cytohesin
MLPVVLAIIFGYGDVTHGQNPAAAVSSREAERTGLAALKETRLDDAITAFQRCLQWVPRDASCAYNLACAYSLKKDATAALEWLARAASWGYENVEHILKDSDLTHVRSHEEFRRLIEDIQNRLPRSVPRRALPNQGLDRGLRLVAMLRSDLGSGAAIIIGRDGNRLVLATANHVVRRGGIEARNLEVQLKDLAPRWEKALLLPTADPELDLAFVVVDHIVGRDLAFCELPLHLGGDSSRLRRGDPVFPVGYPNGILWAMPFTADRVSQTLPIQLSFESQFIRVGFSGGALINRAGELVGMITADEPPLGRAVPLATIIQAARAAQLSVQLSSDGDRAGEPLHAAARNGDVAGLRRMLENCADPNLTDGDRKRTPLHDAAAKGSVDSIQLLLRAGARPHTWAMIRETQSDREWGTPLHVAAEHGHAAAVKALLAAGRDVDIQTLWRYGDRAIARRNTPLQVAAQHDRAQVAEALLAAGAGKEGLGGMTPLEVAAKSGSIAVVKVLIRHGVFLTGRGDRSLHYAAEAGSAEIVTLLVAGGLDVNSRTSGDDTALHKAAEHGQVKTVEALVALKADVNVHGYQGNTPLHLAVEKGKSAVVALLLAKGADANRLNEAGRTPLAIAANRGDIDSMKALVNAKAEIGHSLHVVLDNSDSCRVRDARRQCEAQHEAAARILLDGGADVSLRDSDGRQPLHLAAAAGLTETVALLLELGAPLTTADRREYGGNPPLQLAAERGHVEVVRRLIAAKAPVDQQDRSGRTALYRAVSEKHTAVVELLLRAGADPHLANDYSGSFYNTPLEKAAAGPPEILALLLESGADPNRGGSRTLHEAVARGSVENVRLLLEAGAKPSGNALHIAIDRAIDSRAESLAIKKMELLVNAGIPVDAAGSDGVTPLHVAAKRQNTIAARMLLSKGARVDPVDKCGLTPLWYGLATGGEERALAIAEVLVNAGAAVNVKSTCRRETLLEIVEKNGYFRVRQLLVAKAGTPR